METTDQASFNSRNRAIIVTKFTSHDETATIPVEDLKCDINDDTLIWIEITGDGSDLLADVSRQLDVSQSLVDRVCNLHGCPWIDSDGDEYAICALAADHLGDLEFEGIPLYLLAGRNYVITIHPKPLAFLENLRAREGRRSQVATLTADSFVASLLSWHLDTYFAAASDFERSVERLEESVLRDPTSESVKGLRRLRKGASRLRRMLSAHRVVFTSMARPDFRPDAADKSERHFRALYEQYERAMDVIENARELVIGSFGLFSNQVALQTNGTMRVLTFITVVIGFQTVVAGILGMNFDAPFFKTQGAGFWLAVGVMAAMAVLAGVLGRWRRWI